MVWSHSSIPLLVLFSLLSSLFHSVAASMNVSIDDQLGDEITAAQVTYTPSGIWNLGPNCSGCWLKPDAYDTYDETWHDGTCQVGNDSCTIEISFLGFAVYVYIILPGYVPNAALTTNISFHLDGAEVGTFNTNPGFNTYYTYNYLVYSNASLENTNHTFILSSDAFTNQSVVLFDRLVYSSGDPSSQPSVTSTWEPLTSDAPYTTASATSTSAGTNTLAPLSASSSSDDEPSADKHSTGASRGVIIGASVAGVGCIGLASVIFLCIRLRRRRAMDVSVPWTRKKRPRAMSHGSIDDSEQGISSIRRISSLPLNSPYTESVAAAPAYSTTSRSGAEKRPPHDGAPFRHDEINEKLERLVRPPPSVLTNTTRIRRSSDHVTSNRAMPRSNRWGRDRQEIQRDRRSSAERSLINHIVTLRQEVDLLRDRHSVLSGPPPDYYDGSSAQ